MILSLQWTLRQWSLSLKHLALLPDNPWKFMKQIRRMNSGMIFYGNLQSCIKSGQITKPKRENEDTLSNLLPLLYNTFASWVTWMNSRRPLHLIFYNISWFEELSAGNQLFISLLIGSVTWRQAGTACDKCFVLIERWIDISCMCIVLRW